LSVPTRSASPVAMFASAPGNRPASAPACGASTLRVNANRASCAACSAARSPARAPNRKL
jgi:hypothetical protein